MKTRIFCLVCLFLLGSPLRSFSQVSNKLDHYLEQVFQNHVIPGFSAVVVKDDNIIYKGAYGREQANSTKAFSATTLSAVGSLTKSITSIAIMQLVERGILALDEPVTKYLPEFRTANQKMSDKVTVRMLLNNTAGLKANPSPIMEPSSKALEYLSNSLNSTFLTREPGVSYEYSNTDFSIAGLLISRLTGLDFEDYIAKNIFDPLEMTNTIIGVDNARKGSPISGHYFGLEPLPANSTVFALSGEYVPAGSLTYSTAEDLGNYLIALLANGTFKQKQILTKESIDQLFTPNIHFQGLSKNDGGDGQEYGYGLGWMISTIDGREVIHHGGSTGTMSSFTILDRKNHTAASLLFNLDLTFIDTHKYNPHYTIANNLIHIANGEELSSFGIPVGPDDTLNSFDTVRQQKKKYLGTYSYRQGGLPWMNFGLHLNVSLDSKENLIARAYSANGIVGEFELDLVNPNLAITRNIASPEQLRFYSSAQGKVNTIQWQGRLYEKKKHPLPNRVAYNIEENKTIYLPEDWNLEKTGEGFKASNDSIKATIIGSFTQGNTFIDTYLEKYQIKNKGLTTIENVSHLSWQKQSFEIERKRVLTLFSSKKMLLLIDSPSLEHTKIISGVANSIVKDLSFGNDTFNN